MYSDKEHVNILTALLVEHGVRHAVVCPGSRNAPLVHNLNECPEITCFPVTDERSAGFYALGMAQRHCRPVVVCVTSGSALLNLAPSVAEAYYQHVPIVVISADRPAAWIDQLDGQTLPQPDALGRMVKKAVSLPEPHDEEERWYCNRLINEALLATCHHGKGPVHINVPISEPLYTFTKEVLPKERKIEREESVLSSAEIQQIQERLSSAQRPWIIAGLNVPKELTPWLLATNLLDEKLEKGNIEVPDFILYLGGTLVSKRLKMFLRESKAETWMISEDGEVHDVLMNLTRIIECSPLQVVKSLFPPHKEPLSSGERAYSPMLAVQYLEERLQSDDIVHYANSTAIRLAGKYARHEIYCNRGVNGIEGSLSTAAGFSLVTPERVFCVIGDLSFFYDQNALWNQNLRGNLRILLLNNGGGGIFSKFEGLKNSAARERLVMAKHQTSAEGICAQNHVEYLSAVNQDTLEGGIAWLFANTNRPKLLEVQFEE